MIEIIGFYCVMLHSTDIAHRSQEDWTYCLSYASLNSVSFFVKEKNSRRRRRRRARDVITIVNLRILSYLNCAFMPFLELVTILTLPKISLSSHSVILNQSELSHHQ